MVFSSALFLIYFLPLFLIVYSLCPKQFKNYWILLASICFYAWGAPKFVFVILFSTIIDFYLVKRMELEERKKQRKVLLTISIGLNLGLLLFFKYANFFVENINTILGYANKGEIAWAAIVLPIGISFYTFQTLTYSIDIYRGKEKSLGKLTDYLVYILSFPQMIAGPIVRFSALSKELVYREDLVSDKLIGFYRFSIGLAKKVLIANVLGEQADVIFNGEIASISSIAAWIGLIAYTFQIYFDFSGYSDMAIGLGRMMGFRFPENFNFPYISRSITEFWKRWHITLGAFMKDYLYIPLGGSKVKSKPRLYFNLAIVFLLSGLWHGAAWNFIIWGAFHGVFLILERMFLKDFLARIGSVASILFTFFITMLGWLLFRVENMEQFAVYWSKLFSFEGMGYYDRVPSFTPVLYIAIFLSFSGISQYWQKISGYFFEKVAYSYKEHILLSLFSIIIFVLCIGAISSSHFNPFIYFRF